LAAGQRRLKRLPRPRARIWPRRWRRATQAPWAAPDPRWRGGRLAPAARRPRHTAAARPPV